MHPELVLWVSALDSFHCISTLIVQFQQGSYCSKSAVRNRKTHEICSNLTTKMHQNNVSDIALVSLLLILNIFHNFLYCFSCWLWRLHGICLEKISIGKRSKYFEASGFSCCILNNTHFFWNRSRKLKKFHDVRKTGMSANKMVYPEGTCLWWVFILFYTKLQTYSLCCRQTKGYI